MANQLEKPKKEKRVALSLSSELNSNLVILARLEGLPPAVLARKILSEYLDARADVIEMAKKADNDYQYSLEKIRNQYPK